MLKSIKLLSKLLLVLALLLLHSANTLASEPPDTTKEREPYPEKKGFGQALWTIPQFAINAPVDILTGFSQVVIEDLYAGRLAAKIAALVGELDRVWGFYPIFGAGGNSGAEFGLAFTSKDIFTVEERLKIKGSYSVNDYQSFKIRYKAPKLMGDKLGITLLGQYTQRPQESYFGSGHLSLREDEINYNPERSHLSFGAVWQASHSITVDFKLGYDAYNLYDGENPNLVGNFDTYITFETTIIIDTIISDTSINIDSFTVRQQFGLTLADTRSTRLVSVGGTIDHDWRNDKGQPTAGGREIISVFYYASTEDKDNFKYTSVTVDVRQYFHIFKKRTLALRLMAQTTDLGDALPLMPFYLKPSLGGAETLRGYTRLRFVDNDLALISAEYRYPIWKKIDAFVFLDEARVFKSLTDHFKWHNWKYSYGGGLRAWETDNLILSFYAAKSEEETRFRIQFSDSF